MAEITVNVSYGAAVWPVSVDLTGDNSVDDAQLEAASLVSDTTGASGEFGVSSDVGIDLSWDGDSLVDAVVTGNAR